MLCYFSFVKTQKIHTNLKTIYLSDDEKNTYRENIYLTLDLAVVTMQTPLSNELAMCCTVYKLFHINYSQESYSKY